MICANPLQITLNVKCYEIRCRIVVSGPECSDLQAREAPHATARPMQ
jgi:hypothetical protein